jgi:CRISPR-associated protein (TIGR02710 family)
VHEAVLIATVGGSHQPIVTAIRETAPVFVCFLCTDRDPGTGRPGSRVQIEGKGSVIKAHKCEPAPTLPNIPAQCGLAPERCEVEIVPADDLDGIVSAAAGAIARLRERFPTAHVVADYTGGTKTMTAGLVMAALERDDVELRFVTGARGDLTTVVDGTQHSTAATADGVRLRRAMAPYLNAWARYGYAEAAQGLARVFTPSDAGLRAELQIARDLSAAFDAWDRFDHATALALLHVYRSRIGARAGSHLQFLEWLTAGSDDPRAEPARLLDLWRNAERRAAQGRFDDAVARVYRLIEWTAQWLLRDVAAIDTSDVAQDELPAHIDLSPNRDGKRQAGLLAAWDLVAHHLQGAPRRFATEERSRLLDRIGSRNRSILAHGRTAIGAGEWERFQGWLETAFLPVLREAAAERGLRALPPQLPREPIWRD